MSSKVRKYDSGCEKRKKKKRLELFAQEDIDKQCSPFSLALMIVLHSNNAKQM
jgi:hypothetical protein